MSPAAFEVLRRIALREAGFFVPPAKASFVSSRLQPRISELGLANIEAYAQRCLVNKAETVRFVDLIVTSFTSFFREPDHFDDVAQLARERRGSLFTVWCAAAATGEEPLTLALMLEEVLGNQPWRLLATDISTRALSQAQAATYPLALLEQIPERFRARFSPAPHQPGWVQPAESLRGRIVYARLDLAHPPWPMRGPFDVVMCRNVMMYLEPPAQARAVSAITALLCLGGLLITGHSEPTPRAPPGLELVRPSVLRRVTP